MLTEESLNLALEILQQDVDELEDRQKGKQTSGQLTDLELSLSTMTEDIRALQVCLQDRVLAVSISEAVVTDQSILQAIQQDEAIAEQDHECARAMENNERHVPTPFDPEDAFTREDESNELISTVMGDLMEQMTLTEKPDNGEGSSSRVPSSEARIPCVTCMERFDKADSFLCPCGHSMCYDCIRWLFLGSIRDEELYPPRCCGRIIPPGTALHILDYGELYQFCQRGMEYSAKDRVYCAEPTCSKFIPPFAITDEHGTCPECSRQTHIPCRSLAHPLVDCPADQPLQDVLALAEEENWQRCLNCRMMVELEHGCYHMTCRCGRQFCYLCGQQWKTCDCVHWDENRLHAVAREAVEDEVHPDADRVVRENAFVRIMEELRHHEDDGCDHHRNSQWKWTNRGSTECEVCNFRLPEYIFVCRGCRMRACNRCRRHRLR